MQDGKRVHNGFVNVRAAILLKSEQVVLLVRIPVLVDVLDHKMRQVRLLTEKHGQSTGVGRLNIKPICQLRQDATTLTQFNTQIMAVAELNFASSPILSFYKN